MNLRPLGFLDTSAFTATLWSRHRGKFGDGIIPLRGPSEDEGAKDLAILKDWKAAKALLTRIRNASAPFFGGMPADLGVAAVEILHPGQCREWHEDADDEDWHRLHVCLIPSPGAWLYCGGESMCAPVGQIVYMNRMALHSEVNFGPCARVHLVLDVKKPDET